MRRSGRTSISPPPPPVGIIADANETNARKSVSITATRPRKYFPLPILPRKRRTAVIEVGDSAFAFTSPLIVLVPQQFVDRGLGARLRIDTLDDHGAGERGAGRSVR